MDDRTPAPAAPDGNQPVTPPPAVPATPPPAEDVAKLKAEKEELAKKLAEKEQYITQVQTEKATLEARLQGVQPHNQAAVSGDIEQEAQKILETAQLDPATASKDLAALIKKTQDQTQKQILENLNPIIEQNTYIAKVREENKDLIELGLEPAIGMRAQQLMAQGKPFKESVDTAIRERREIVDKKFKSNIPPTPPPAGAVGEGGANHAPPPPPPPPREETSSEEISRLREQRRKQGL